MYNSNLLSIQKLQFTDRPGAEIALLNLLTSMGHSDLKAVELSPKPESLNSINGLVTLADSTKLFFKTHTEETEELAEYYNSELLAKYGYPVINPKQVRTKPGEQIAFYEVISHRTLFDLVKFEEDQSPEKVQDFGTRLLIAQKDLDQRTTQIYQSTLKQTTAQTNANQPIHQLFSSRLAEKGRYGNFYRGKFVDFGSLSILFDELETLRWKINGVSYKSNLLQVVQEARKVLNPFTSTLSVIGHGDAHNGNIFFNADQNKLLYFDAAFAGRHNPLLDLTKPIFHNIFARWMYFPDEANQELSFRVKTQNDEIVVEHTFVPSLIRRRFLESKLKFVLQPLSLQLQKLGVTRDEQIALLRSALLCCPLLTVNLAAPYLGKGNLSERYQSISKLLGFALSIQLASEVSSGHSELQETINSIFDAIL
jgi:hypothetical protein